MRVSLALLASIVSCQLANAFETTTITAKNLETLEKYSFFTLIHNEETGSYNIESLNTEIPNDTSALFCFESSRSDEGCFTVTRLHSSLSYNLLIDNDKKKLSLSYNGGSTNSIVPVVNEPISGATAEITKLRKVTKQYPKNKKTSLKSPYQHDNLEKADVDLAKEVDEEKKSTFLEKNWRYMIVGLLLYFLLNNKSDPQPEKEKKN